MIDEHFYQKYIWADRVAVRLLNIYLIEEENSWVLPQISSLAGSMSALHDLGIKWNASPDLVDFLCVRPASLLQYIPAFPKILIQARDARIWHHS